MKKSLVATYPTLMTAEIVVGELIAAGFARADIGLAVSEDGVHWQEECPVLDLAFRTHRQVYKPFVARCGDRFIMNHGAFSGQPGTGSRA